VSAAFGRWFNSWALLLGWTVGTGTGTAMVWAANFAPTYPLTAGRFVFPGYIAIYSLIANLATAISLTLLFNTIRQRRIGSPPMMVGPA
jgi:hypothetical protein